MSIDRRQLLATGMFGLGAFAMPGFARAYQRGAGGFTHNVASGEPGTHSVLLWTRYLPAGGGEARLTVELAEDEAFRRVAGGGQMVTGPWRDHTAKLTVTGLRPGTRYFYRFVAPDGSRSPVGRTRTLPEAADRFTLATFSCSNIGFGHFNAYAHAAARDDIDLALHLGDYIYEYGPGVYPAAAMAVAGRDAAHDREIVSLVDYRLRYASYRADPDLQRLHQLKPMIVSMDDHESANNSWEGGAQNHSSGQGDWNARKAAALQAWREWMPVSDEPWAAYRIGDLASLYRTDTRLAARSRGIELDARTIADPRALAAFRDGPWRDPAATMLGSTQEAWLARELAASVRAGVAWQLFGSGTNVGRTVTPADAANWLTPGSSERARRAVLGGVALGRAGLARDLDNWNGYPAARARLLGEAQRLGANFIVLSGDSHNAWAYDLAEDGRAAGVEFGGHAVSSAGLESVGWAVPATRIAASLVAANPELAWCDTSRRGYMATTLTRETATNDWVFMDSVARRSTRTQPAHRMRVQRGTNRLG